MEIREVREVQLHMMNFYMQHHVAAIPLKQVSSCSIVTEPSYKVLENIWK